MTANHSSHFSVRSRSSGVAMSPQGIIRNSSSMVGSSLPVGFPAQGTQGYGLQHQHKAQLLAELEVVDESR